MTKFQKRSSLLLVMVKAGLVLKIILLIFGVSVLAVVGAGTAVLVGSAPQCPSGSSATKTEKAIGDALENGGSITITDSEATFLAQRYIKNQVQDARICFTSGLGHASGKIKLGPFNPSFYASASVDLSGSNPKAVDLNIKAGSLPDLPVVSAQVANFVTNLINDNLDTIELDKPYSANFASGSVTIN